MRPMFEYRLLSRATLGAVLAALAGCSTPLQDCISRAQGPLEAVEADINRTAANLERGYAVHRSVERRSPVVFCGGLGRSHNHVSVFVNGCTDGYREVERPVAIDTAFERQKLDTLREQELTLRQQTQRSVSRCYDVHAEG